MMELENYKKKKEGGERKKGKKKEEGDATISNHSDQDGPAIEPPIKSTKEETQVKFCVIFRQRKTKRQVTKKKIKASIIPC